MSNSALKSFEYPEKSGIRIREKLNVDGEKAFGCSYQVNVPVKVTGKTRKRKQFTDLDKAKEWAKREANGAKLQGESYFRASSQERDEFAELVPKLRAAGVRGRSSSSHSRGMARKANFKFKTVYLFSRLNELSDAAKDGNPEAGGIAARIKEALPPEERIELCEFEVKFLKEFKAWSERVDRTKEAVGKFYEAFPELDARSEYQKRNHLPMAAHVADIVAFNIDGGQQATDGRQMAVRLHESISPMEKGWFQVESQEQRKRTVEEVEAFIGQFISGR
jgi:hypothetical protein